MNTHEVVRCAVIFNTSLEPKSELRFFMASSNRRNFILLHCHLLPRAAMVLRELLRLSWANGKSRQWRDTVEEGEIFTTKRGKQVLEGTSERQKKLLVSGDVKMWNLKLLCHVLRKMDFGKGNLTKDDKKNLLVLDQARREISRCPNQIFSNSDFNCLWKAIDEVLVHFGHSAIELFNMKMSKCILQQFDPKVTNPHIKNIESKILKNGQFQEAIDKCNELLISPGLTDGDIAALHVNRSAAYLLGAQSKKTSETDWKKLAKEDAKAAVNRFATSVSAYNQLGQVYCASGLRTKATKYFTIAEALKQTNEEMKSFNSEEESELAGRLDNLCLYDVVRPKPNQNMKETDDEIAMLNAQAYATLATRGKAIGLCNLAGMYYEGRGGLEKNPKTAVKLLKEAVSRPAFKNGKRNPGVAEAEHALACNYELGLGGLMINKQKAAALYAKAVEHGHIASANNLACLYFIGGKSIERNCGKAVEYWQIAASHGDNSAMQSLANYYLVDVKDPEQAIEWQRKAITSGNASAKSLNAQFISDVNTLKKKLQDLDLKVHQWEKENKISTQSSLKARRERYLKEAVDAPIEFQKKSTKIKVPSTPEIIPTFFVDSTYRYNLDVLKTYVLKGSLTAGLLKRAVVHFDAALNILDKHMSKCPPSFINELADCIRIDYSVATWSPSEHTLGCRVVANALKKSDNKLSELDKNARICHAYFYADAFPDMKVFLRQCVEKYPEEITFPILLAFTLAYLTEYEQGIKVADEALKMFPEHGELLFARAINVRLLPSNLSAIVEGYQRFINAVPEDHRKVPEAYYTIACECLVAKNRDVTDVVNYYFKGLTKEKVQLPCFLPYSDCPAKAKLEKLMETEPFKTILNQFARALNELK
uniref:Uncharacterized protein n=1 Tax=Strigamia maritima TaxID=126957 RepID=T1IM72_STRMM